MKKILSFFVAGLVTFSGISPFLSLNGQYINTYEVAGYVIVELFSLVYLYSYYSKQKNIKLISIAGILCGYITTLFIVSNTFNKYAGAPFKLNIGFYLYIASFILLLISLLIPTKKIISEEEKKIMEETKNKKYILPIYMYGIKNRPELANNRCSLSYNDDKNIINVRIVNKENLEAIDIPFEFIVSINVKPSLTMVTTNYSLQEDSTALGMIAAYMFGSAGSLVGQLMDNASSTVNTKYSTVFITEINYLKNNEKEKIVIQTNYPPKEFFDELKDKYFEQNI